MVIETTLPIGDANLGSENKNCALVRHGVGEVERCHRILSVIIGEGPYRPTCSNSQRKLDHDQGPRIQAQFLHSWSRKSLSVFTAKPAQGYP